MGQCQSIIRTGQQCSRPALPKRRYCWQHESQLFQGISIGGAIAILFGVVELLANLKTLGIGFPVNTQIPVITPGNVTYSSINNETFTYTPTLFTTPSLTLAPTFTNTSTISYIANGFCTESPEPCFYIPSSIDTWKSIASKTSYQNECRWPEIANVNRNISGNYRILDYLLTTAGVFIPPSDRINEYKPAIRQNSGLLTIINQCPIQYSVNDLPCIYTINEKDGATGSYYKPIAVKFYNTYEYNGVKLDEYIQSANLLEGCFDKPIQLLPGVSIVIPKYPSDRYE
jgi:hypothetical protein